MPSDVTQGPRRESGRRRRPLVVTTRVIALGLGLVWSSASGLAQAPPSIAARPQGMQRIEGFMPMHWDARAGTLWMEIARFDSELLYVRALAAEGVELLP